MINLLTLYPPYLVVLTVLLVFLPTLLSIGVRVTLYRYFLDSADKVKRLINGNSKGIQPKIVSNLEERFRKASEYLESVNTSALIDELYGEETFPLLGFSLGCVKWDYLGTILPNLLLAFGLLGTFWGITTNLANIGSVINQGNATSSDLINQLQIPLRSMGIAFITSLVALLCSSILTVVNFFFNTNVARIALLSSLEDYLDNIVQPTIEGRSRLDRAVNRMVEQQNEFLLNFHDKVTKILESSLTKVAQKIDDGNQETTKLVIQVCDRLNETAVTLSHGGDNFNRSTQSFKEQVTKLDTLIQHRNFVKYSTTLESCVTNLKNIVDTLVRSKVTENLVTATQNINATQDQFSTTVRSLQEFSNVIQKAIDTLNSSVQKSLTIEEQIRDTSQDFYELQTRNYQLSSEFAEKAINYLETLQNSSYLLNSLVNQISTVEQQIQDEDKNSNAALREKIDQLIMSIQYVHNSLLETSHNVNSQSGQLQSLGDQLTKAIVKEGERNNYQNQIISQKSEQTAGYLRDIQLILQQLIATLNQQKDNQANANQLKDFNSRTNLS